MGREEKERERAVEKTSVPVNYEATSPVRLIAFRAFLSQCHCASVSPEKQAGQGWSPFTDEATEMHGGGTYPRTPAEELVTEPRGAPKAAALAPGSRFSVPETLASGLGMTSRGTGGWANHLGFSSGS